MEEGLPRVLFLCFPALLSLFMCPLPLYSLLFICSLI